MSPFHDVCTTVSILKSKSSKDSHDVLIAKEIIPPEAGNVAEVSIQEVSLSFIFPFLAPLVPELNSPPVFVVIQLALPPVVNGGIVLSSKPSVNNVASRY